MAQIQQWFHDNFPALTGTLLAATLVSLGLFAGGVFLNRSLDYSYMVWNLFLAWLPLVLMYWLTQMLAYKRWSSWQGIGLSVLWLGFLPNSFYMVTDYIHLVDAPRLDVLYDAVMLTSFVVNGLILGYLSLYLFHNQLLGRLRASSVTRLIAFVLFLCSFAIYLGRDLRWNSWDLFVNPAGILFDVSDRLIHPTDHPQMFVTVLSVYALLGALYFVIRSCIRTVRRAEP